MNEQLVTYVRPVLVELGAFAELTLGAHSGTYVDGTWGGWWF